MAIATATVSFTATDTGAATFSPSLTSNPAKILGASAVPSDGGGPVAVELTSVTNTGATVNLSGPITGTVCIVASD